MTNDIIFFFFFTERSINHKYSNGNVEHDLLRVDRRVSIIIMIVRTEKKLE